MYSINTEMQSICRFCNKITKFGTKSGNYNIFDCNNCIHYTFDINTINNNLAFERFVFDKIIIHFDYELDIYKIISYIEDNDFIICLQTNNYKKFSFDDIKKIHDNVLKSIILT